MKPTELDLKIANAQKDLNLLMRERERIAEANSNPGKLKALNNKLTQLESELSNIEKQTPKREQTVWNFESLEIRENSSLSDVLASLSKHNVDLSQCIFEYPEYEGASMSLSITCPNYLAQAAEERYKNTLQQFQSKLNAKKMEIESVKKEIAHRESL